MYDINLTVNFNISIIAKCVGKHIYNRIINLQNMKMYIKFHLVCAQ